MAAGIMGGLAVPSQSVDLQPGDMVVFYTDGVTEAFDAAGNQYGEPQLLAALGGLAGSTAAAATAALLSSVRGHAGEHPQSDDIAVLALKRQA
jgi:sigma-B regulation protein RsbU (phosphoserine phosphatase)